MSFELMELRVKENNLAYQMALRSHRCVHTHDKQDWLAMFAEDAVVEDPIGATPLDPEGNGHRGLAALEAFWDRNIAPNQNRIEILQGFTAADNECALVLRLTIQLDYHGKRFQQIVNGIFTYAVNKEGLLQSLRGYWEYDEGLATLTELS